MNRGTRHSPNSNHDPIPTPNPNLAVARQHNPPHGAITRHQLYQSSALFSLPVLHAKRYPEPYPYFCSLPCSHPAAAPPATRRHHSASVLLTRCSPLTPCPARLALILTLTLTLSRCSPLTPCPARLALILTLTLTLTRCSTPHSLPCAPRSRPAAAPPATRRRCSAPAVHII